MKRASTVAEARSTYAVTTRGNMLMIHSPQEKRENSASIHITKDTQNLRDLNLISKNEEKTAQTGTACYTREISRE